MEIEQLKIPDVWLLKNKVFADDRGFFFESYNADEFARMGIPEPFVQDNVSGSKHGTLRGLHYQIQRPQGKLVRVIVGEIFDVAVDLRKSSPTFKAWVGTGLAASDRSQLWIPPGFAHGFLVLSEWAEVLYKVTEFYAPDQERTLLWSDPELGIAWPLEPEQNPLLSVKDTAGAAFQDADLFQ